MSCKSEDVLVKSEITRDLGGNEITGSPLLSRELSDAVVHCRERN